MKKTNLSENDTVMQDAEIVSEFAKEFSLDDMNITKMESDDMLNLPNILPSQTMLIPTSGILNEQQNDDMSDIESSDQESGSMGKENLLSNKISIGGNANNRNASNKFKDEISPKFKEIGLLKLKKSAKIREKKEKKERRRRDKVGADLSHGMEAAFETL